MIECRDVRVAIADKGLTTVDADKGITRRMGSFCLPDTYQIAEIDDVPKMETHYLCKDYYEKCISYLIRQNPTSYWERDEVFKHSLVCANCGFQVDEGSMTAYSLSGHGEADSTFFRFCPNCGKMMAKNKEEYYGNQVSYSSYLL